MPQLHKFAVNKTKPKIAPTLSLYSLHTSGVFLFICFARCSRRVPNHAASLPAERAGESEGAHESAWPFALIGSEFLVEGKLTVCFRGNKDARRESEFGGSGARFIFSGECHAWMRVCRAPVLGSNVPVI